MTKFTWTTKAGDILQMHEITNRHFVNIILMKTRNAIGNSCPVVSASEFGAIFLGAAAFLRGEHALDTIEDNYDDYSEAISWQDTIRINHKCRALRNELHNNRNNLISELAIRLTNIHDEAPACWGITEKEKL